MKGKGALWIWVGLLVVFLAGIGFVGYKLYKRQYYKKLAAEQQRWEVRSETRLSVPLEGEDLANYLASENERIDRYEVVRPVVEDLDLVAYWGVEDADAAMEKLKASTEVRAGDEPGVVMFVISDKDKEMAAKLGQEVSKSYKAMILRERLLPPMPPAEAGE